MSLWEAVGSDLHRRRATRSYRQAARAFYEAAPRGDGRRRRRALARGGRPLHADVHAGRERPDGVRAREAELADQPRRCANGPSRTSTRRSGSTPGRTDLRGQDAGPRSEQGERRAARRLLGARGAGRRPARHALRRGRPGPAARRRRSSPTASSWYRRFRPDAFGVEANQFQDLLGGEFEAEFRRQGLLGARPWPIDNHVNKLVRIRRLGPVPGGAAAAVQERLALDAAAGRAAPGRSPSATTTTAPTPPKWPSAWPPSCSTAAGRRRPRQSAAGGSDGEGRGDQG